MEQKRWSLNAYGRVWSLALGVLLLFCIRFLGVPIILENFHSSPAPEVELLAQAASAKNSAELLSGTASSFYWALGIFALALAAIPFYKGRVSGSTKWILASLVAWMFLVATSALQTIDSALSLPTLLHLLTCGVCFWIGYKALGQNVENQKPFLWILSGALVPVLLSAFQQHYGGLAEVQKNIFALVPPENLPEDFVRRITSGRVYGTLVYPNSLAGLLLLLLPPCVCALWELPSKIPPMIRMLLAGMLAYMGLAALFWSGSKTAWLILIALGIVVLFAKARMPRRYKITTAMAILCVGLIGFGIVFSDYFKRGATSVGARFDYWHAAALNIQEYPLLGSGPGTFALVYQKTKKPESEMARLCHNDYLEQASDSGLPAAVAYLGFIGGCLFLCWRRAAQLSPLSFCMLLGICGFALQGFSDFSLYIPAIAWPFFVLLGVSHSLSMRRE